MKAPRILPEVLGVRFTAHEGYLDFTLKNGERVYDFTYHPSDKAPTTLFLNQWIEGHPEMSPEPYVPHVPPANTIPLTPRQFRMALIKSKVSPKELLGKLDTIDGLEHDELVTHLEYTTTFRFDDPLTTRLLRIAGIKEEDAEAVWQLGFKQER
jgi:hypothetical protein